ncbi:KAP family P-loop NTPase fold protein [Cohnella silvisoli]|uniref:P-loop NTPase fold protein n=1 Tax=Cohnella silvisoli TaxID=2873699 RepID=A0ABV1KPY5_9BACL|nr:P-loop NTPase fold protein [Cohnella silvisoli]
MQETNKSYQLIKINCFFLFKIFLFGIILAEFALCTKVILLGFENSSAQNQRECWFWTIIGLYFLIACIYLYRRKKQIKFIVKSWRFDLLLVFSAGVISMIVVGGLGISFFQKWISSLSWLYTVVLLSIPLVFYAAINLRKLQIKMTKKSDENSGFMSDKEGQSKNDDAFEFFEIAKRFAGRVYNQGSPESLVFGIDAPWGTGKSTFINLCREHWRADFKDKVIVYRFDPLRFENSDKLLDKFVDGLLKVIKDNFYAPELESLVAKYAKLLSDSKLTISILGFRFGVPFDKSSIDRTFEGLDEVLRRVDKKIVIVVDDLDRLSFSSIKEILFVIKKSFILPNISYVLCYDTENITALEHQKLDSEKIIEFLEKFINIKMSLYLDHKLLLDYFTEYKDRSLARNLLSNPELVSRAVEGLKDIFNSKEYYLYIPFIGDARKLKRLVNTILLLEVEQLDLSNADFDKSDLVHLLIIYINYPNIFRKIYNTEMHGKRGFFSLVGQFDDHYPKDSGIMNTDNGYKNSTLYTQYVADLTENQRFILNKVFNADQRLQSARNITAEQATSYACFNGSLFIPKGGNLERYLNLIVKVSRPVQTEQYKFYVNLKNEILEKTNIADVLQHEEFSFSKGEGNHEQLWRVLINSPHSEYSPIKAKEIIQYALDNLSRYSMLEIENVGLRRNSIILFIAKLLDKVGWTDEEGKYWINTNENVVKIAEWIFGENQHKNSGILENIAREERGILGLHDLLLFRLYCCADRGGDMFNLTRALSRHGGPNNPTEGIVRNIVIGEMREISQYVFRVFKARYIDKSKNIFEEVLELSAEAVCANSYSYINSQIPDDSFNSKLLELKSRMLSFITYQLGSATYSSGIPCGYYDIEGEEDKHGINEAINDYLFEICFNPERYDKGYNYFLYYLLINNRDGFGHEVERIPAIDKFTEVLNEDRIRKYWGVHGESVRVQESILEKGNFIADEYVAWCANQIGNVYKVLDKLIEEH